jgi:hypothetical protein
MHLSFANNNIPMSYGTGYVYKKNLKRLRIYISFVKRRKLNISRIT